MTLNIYIDESGNTGDVVVNKMEDFLFNNQPYFVLAAIGTNEKNNDNEKLKNIVKQLRSKHNISEENELKASSLYGSKPDFILELFEGLHTQNFPMFVEVNDKKFFLSSQISTLLLNPILYEYEISDYLISFMKQCAEFLYNELPREIFINFSRACRERTHSEFMIFINNIGEWLLQTTNDLSNSLSKLHTEIVENYIELKEVKNLPKAAVEYFLPEADNNLKGKIISSLPHVTALATICARVEKYSVDMNIKKLSFVHDEQKHLGQILLKNVEYLSKENYNGYSKESHLNDRVLYHFINEIQFSFENSKKSLGVQIADLLAGSIYRFWVDYEKNGNQFNKEFHKFLHQFFLENTHPSCGMNLVIPQSNVDSFLKWKEVKNTI